ncbi:MAG TPA: hypothetical protein VF765_25830 [Polyangiaceae bacterium]
MRRLAAAAAAAIAVLVESVASAQSAAPMQLLRPNPEDTVHIDAYLGIEYATVGRQYEEFQQRGLSREPYVLKTADFQISNLSRFDFALDAAATSLFAIGGFTKPSDTPTDPTTADAERYAGLVSYALGKHIKLRTEAHFARLTTYLAPQFENGSNYPVTTYSVPSSGPMARLHPGGGVGGNTTWYSAGFDVEGSADDFLGTKAGGAFGYRFFSLDTLSPYVIKDGNAPQFQGVVADSFTCHAASLDLRDTVQLFSDMVLQMDLHFIGGYSSVTSGLLDNASGVCFGEGGTAALVFTQPHWSITIGTWFDQVSAITVGGGSTLSQNVPYNNPSTGRVSNAAAGSQWNVSGPGEAINTLGPFLHLTGSF